MKGDCLDVGDFWSFAKGPSVGVHRSGLAAAEVVLTGPGKSLPERALPGWL